MTQKHFLLTVSRTATVQEPESALQDSTHCMGWARCRGIVSNWAEELQLRLTLQEGTDPFLSTAIVRWHRIGLDAAQPAGVVWRK